MKPQLVKVIGRYRIERGVPIPSRYGDKVRTMREMEIGDSVVLPRQEANWWTSISSKLGLSFATRKISDTHARCWRVEKKANPRGKKGAK